MTLRGTTQVGIMMGLALAFCACTAPTSAVRETSGTGAEVEVPTAYARTEAGLWDGRPSLGGVWVAHPGVKAPRRVMIHNTENGKSIAGAMFRRERDLPGTRLQVSSDAAQALGMLAGAPAKLSVIALEQAPPPVAEAPKKAAPEQPPAKAAAPVAAARATATATATAIKAANAKPVSVPTPAKMPASAAKAPTQTVAGQTPAPVTTPPGYYVQLGLFSVEQNARQATEALASATTEGEVRKHVSGAKTYWSVVAGPAKTPADQELLLKKVRGLGYADAYAIRK
ncbi:MAG TPA: SPOR domain-containing protein [Paenirhodobacter sp.]